MMPESSAPLPAVGRSALSVLLFLRGSGHLAQCPGILGISLPAPGRIFHAGRFCKIRPLYQNPVASENVPGSLTFPVCNRFYRRNVIWNAVVLSDGQTRNGRSFEDPPKLSELELRVAVHDAWEPGQAVSKPSSLEEGPAVRCEIVVFTSHLGPQGKRTCWWRGSKGSVGLGSCKQPSVTWTK